MHAQPSTPNQGQRRRFSLAYVLWLNGIMAASFLPLSYWGWSGCLVCGWLLAIGLCLLHDKYLIAGVLVIAGIILSPSLDEYLGTIAHRRPDSAAVSGELILVVFATITCCITLVAVGVWFSRSTPLGMKRVMAETLAQNLAPSNRLRSQQISLGQMLGLLTATCVALIPIKYLGFVQGTLVAPFLMATGALLVLGHHRAAIASCIAYPILFRLLS